jgi:beta-xylosidase
VFFGTPDDGYFMSSAANPVGPWTAPHAIFREAGWDDPAVLWDDDGKAYFLGTHFSDGYKSYIWPMSADGRSIDRQSGVLVNAGAGREASKLLKINGWYYLIYSEVGQGGRYVIAKRARAPMGPYSEGRQLAEVGRDANEPNQGGLIHAHDGKWYFLTHHGRQDWEGRAMSLLPITWTDGWPILGTPRPDGVGSMTWSGVKPVARGKPAARRSIDNFNRPSLGPDWEWTRNPRPGKWSLTERPGWMRLHAWRPAKPGDPLSVGNILTQRAWRTTAAQMTVKLDLAGMTDGQHAGLGHFSNTYGMLGAYRQGGIRRLEYRRAGAAPQLGQVLKSRNLWLRMAWGLTGEASFAYSLDGRRFLPFGDVTQQTRASYRGSRVGVVSYNDEAESGHVDIDRVDYDYSR